jgi:hypothetical protein
MSRAPVPRAAGIDPNRWTSLIFQRMGGAARNRGTQSKMGTRQRNKPEGVAFAADAAYTLERFAPGGRLETSLPDL